MRKLLWAGVLLGTLGLICLFGVAIIDATGEAVYPIQALQPEQPRFRIGVLGDSQKGLSNLRDITSRVLREDVSLLLHTGDLVSNNDEGHYRLARRALTRGGAKVMPFVAPGNHDVKGGDARFRVWCGDPEKTLLFSGVAVVLLDNATGGPPDLNRVEARISAVGPHRRLILAMHQPPFDAEGQAKPEFSGFLAWLETSKVDYLLCGHVHAYLKKKVGSTTVIVNGVGGDYDSWQTGQPVYATLLDIDDASISDRRVELEPVHELWENVEHLAIGHVAEAYRRHPFWCWLGTVVLVKLVVLGWVRLLRRRTETQSQNVTNRLL